MAEEPQLEPPGAGLPAKEEALIRNVAFPLLKLKLHSPKACLKLFRKSGDDILQRVKPYELEDFSQPVLIKRLKGMEDSSRYWSLEQTMEHIQIVGAACLYVIRRLETGLIPELPMRTEDAKPTGGLGLDRKRAFRDYLVESPAILGNYSFKTKATYPHPWFGELTSLDWLRLFAFHQNLHREQTALIVKGLKSQPKT